VRMECCATPENMSTAKRRGYGSITTQVESCAALRPIETRHFLPMMPLEGYALRLRERVFISAAAVDDRYWDFKQPEVHRQLASMVVPVVQHD
jgi:hypothetical protein